MVKETDCFLELVQGLPGLNYINTLVEQCFEF